MRRKQDNEIKTKKHHFTTLSLLALFVLGFAQLSLQAQDVRPNIVLIVIDELGWADIGCNGNHYIETPNIDSLASRGIVFTDASSTSPNSEAALKSIYSGRYPVNNSLGNDFLHDVLSKNAYACWHIGRTEKGKASLSDTYLNSFDAVISLKEGNDAFLQPASDLLNQMDERPFFMNLSLPSANYQSGQRLVAENYFKEKALKGGWESALSKDIWCPHYFSNLMLFARVPHTKIKEEAAYATYLNKLDAQLGQLFRYMQEKGVYDKSVIILCSEDGGDCKSRRLVCNTPLRGEVGSMYEGGIRVPLILNIPSLHRIGHRCHQAVSLIDVYPTLLELCGIEPDNNQALDGLSLAEVLNYKCEVDRDAIFWHSENERKQGSSSAIRCCEWKYIVDHQNNQIELFHLGKDLGESKNIANRFPLKRDCMQRKLNVWLRSVGKEQFVDTSVEIADQDCEEHLTTKNR